MSARTCRGSACALPLSVFRHARRGGSHANNVQPSRKEARRGPKRHFRIDHELLLALSAPCHGPAHTPADNAPVSKAWGALTIGCSVAALIRPSLAPVLAIQPTTHAAWSALTHTLVFSRPHDIFCAAVLIYSFRGIERRLATRKFAVSWALLDHYCRVQCCMWCFGPRQSSIHHRLLF